MSTWKKTLGLAQAGLVILMLGTFKPASAATSATINVLVTVDLIAITIPVSSNTWAISGTVTPGSINISSAIAVTNSGNRQEAYSLSLTFDAAGWTPSDDGTVDTDKFAMMALFSGRTVDQIANTDFVGAPDTVIKDTPNPASASAYGINAEGGATKGSAVAASAVRSLYLNFRAPSANTQSGQQSATVTITAAAG